MKLRNGTLDVEYLYNIVKDKRNFHSEVNMLNAAMKAVKLPFHMSQFWTQAYQFIFITLMKYITGFVQKLNIITTV